MKEEIQKGKGYKMSKIFQTIAICGCVSLVFAQNSFGSKHVPACVEYFKQQSQTEKIWECCAECVSKNPDPKERPEALRNCIRRWCFGNH